jgi:hypothetical protein
MGSEAVEASDFQNIAVILSLAGVMSFTRWTRDWEQRKTRFRRYSPEHRAGMLQRRAWYRHGHRTEITERNRAWYRFKKRGANE